MTERKHIISLVGGPGAGKTTAAKIFTENGYAAFAMSEVRRVAGLSHNVNVDDFYEMRRFTKQFYERNGKDVFVLYCLLNIQSRFENKVVLEGLRDTHSIASCRRFCNENAWKLTLVGISTSLETSVERVLTRARIKDPQTEPEVRDYISNRQVKVLPALELCDTILTNDGTLDDLRTAILAEIWKHPHTE